MISRLHSIIDPLSFWLLGLLLFMLPFEVIRPVFTGFGMDITNLEIMVGLTLLTGLVNGVVNWRHLPGREAISRLLLPAGLLCLFALISALLAPQHQLPAFKSTLRLGVGILFMVVVWSQATRPDRFTGLIWAIVAGATSAACIGLLERATLSELAPFFLLFKERATFVGAEVRVSGSFQYATIAAMYWEMALPLALVLAAKREERFRYGRWLALGAALLLTVAIVLSLTRAGLITLVFMLAGMLSLSRIQPRFRGLWQPAGVSALFLMGFLVVMTAGNRSFRARLVTENDADWYGAAYEVPAAITMTSGESLPVEVRVANTGRIDWITREPHPFLLGYQWLTADGNLVYDLPVEYVALPGTIRPGERVTLIPSVVAGLPAGEYRLSWGMHHFNLLSFNGRGVLEAETRVTIQPGAVVIAAPETSPRNPLETRGQLLDIISRRDLWLAAGRMGLDRPVWGHGLNNFRLLYGTYLNQDSWDMRNSANNLYLELFADLGVIGLLAAGWLAVAAGQLLWRNRLSIWTVGLAVSLAALVIHGFLDYFFEFLGVFLLFWAILGLAAALSGREQTDEFNSFL